MRFGDVVKNTNIVERNPIAAGIKRVVGLEHIEPENLHIRSWNNIDEGTSFTKKFVPGQTLFGKRRAYQRKVAYADFEGLCSGDILTFETKGSNILLPELLPFICQTDVFFDYALGTLAGSLSPRNSWSAFKDFEFSLPPIKEQKRIAEILWILDETIQAYFKVKDRIAALRKSYFIHKCQCNLSQEALKNISVTTTGWPVMPLRDCIRIESKKAAHPILQSST